MDQIRFNSLGIMLDCSRNGVMTVKALKSFMDLMQKMGYNRLMLYTEDTYEVEGEEFFGYFRGRYSADELKAIDDYAFKRGIELVPCIQTLAHFTALVRWKKYHDMKDIDDILLAGDERTYTLIDSMLSSLRKCFRTDKIHIGMDEAHNLGKGKYRDINGERDRTEILLEHLNRVCEISKKYGFKPMIWGDMFYRIAAGGEYYATDTAFDASVKERIPEQVSLVYWDYYHINKKIYDDMLAGHKQLSDHILFAGGAWKWGSFAPNNELSIRANELAFASCIENNIKDVFITMWGDDGAEASIYSVLPTLVNAACVARGITDIAEIKKRFSEWTGCSYDDFMLLDLPDKQEGVALDRVINPCKYQLYNDCFMGIYDTGVYNGDGRYYGELSEKISAAAESSVGYAYVFDTIAKLCDVLELKSEIGIRTRKAYLADDRAELIRLLEDYAEIIKRTEALYDSIRIQWYKENKPQGFEVQDLRLGGLIMRIKNCRIRLLDYLNGDVKSIPELEEKVLPCIEKKAHVGNWMQMISTNVL